MSLSAEALRTHVSFNWMHRNIANQFAHLRRSGLYGCLLDVRVAQDFQKGALRDLSHG